DPAIESFRAALNVNPYIENAYNGLAAAYEGKHEWQLAADTWTLAMQHNSQNFDAMFHAAYDYIQLNQPEKAIPLLKQFEQNAPPTRYGKLIADARLMIDKLEHK